MFSQPYIQQTKYKKQSIQESRQMQSKYQIQDAIQVFCKSFPSLTSKNHIRYADLSDGFIFLEILKSAPQIKISTDELDQTQGKWILKLGNLKKIIKRLQHYCSTKLNKTLLTKDIDLIQLTKNNSPEEIIKYFELIIAIVMQGPYKEEYIQRIMSLDQKSQSIFVNIIQNALDNRIALSAKNQTIKLQDEIKMLKQQNEHLREEMSFFTKTNKNYKKEIEQLKEKVQQQTQQIQNFKYSQIQKTNQSLTIQLNQQRSLTQNLKSKLLSIARDHQIQISKYRQQISIYEIKLQNLQSLQNNLQMYKQRYTEALKQSYRKQEVQKEKRKLQKQLQDKQATIKKLNQRIQEYEAKRQNMEQNQIIMKMELQKKQVRFKQLEKEVRSRLNQKDQAINNIPSVILEQSLDDQRLQTHLEQMEFLKTQIQKLRNSNRQLERENLKNKKKIQKLNQLQKQKKKLQRMILQVSKSRDAEIEMLVVSMWELRNQNFRIFQLLQQKNNVQSRN